MSMTQEETIINLEKLIALFHTASEQSKMVDYSKIIETLEFAAAALSPVSRERVDKVWRGEWIGDNDEKVGTIDGSPIKSSTCSVCGNWLVGSDEYDCAGYFCPTCGSAMTDEAVEMVMERLEAIHNDC